MKRGNTMYIMLAVLAALIFAFLWYTEKTRTSKQAVSTPPPYQTASDLDRAARELDGTNLNQMDTELKQIDSEANF